MNAPPICLFVFCCSSGVYLFKQTTTTPNLQIKNFMEKTNRKIFIGFRLHGIFPKIKRLFGDKFFMNFSCAPYLYLPRDMNTDLNQIILKYAGTPLINYDYKNSILANWNKSKLSAKDVMIAAFEVYAFSLCYPNLKKIKPANKICKKGKFIFKNGLVPRENIPFNIGDSYLVEFFNGTFTPVVLLDANSDVQKYINIISKDSNIFADFEYVSDFIDVTNLIPINVFTFCCKSGVFVFQQTEFEKNDQIGEFLRKKEGQKFYTFNTGSLKPKLKKLFGNDFDINYEDVSHTRIENYSKKQICKFVKKFSIGSVVNKGIENVKKSFWTKKNLSIEQVLFTAFTSYALSRCFENFPPIIHNPDEEFDEIENDDEDFDIENDDEGSENEIVDYGQIKFTSDTPLLSFAKSNWKVGGSAEIEYFPGTFSKVYLLDAVTDFPKYEKIISSDKIIFVDFEYLPSFRKEVFPICLFQFCTSKGAFLFRQRNSNLNESLKKFMSKENGLKFVGKGIGGDLMRLKKFFGNDFDMNIEDIEETRLLPYYESLNFAMMTEKFGGKPTAEFKNKKISCSNWDAKILRKIQVIYSAFDVVALFQCYPHFQPPKLIEYKAPIKIESHMKKYFIQWAISYNLFDKKDENDNRKINLFWNSNYNLVMQFLNVDFKLLRETVMNAIFIAQDHKLKCRICRSKQYEYFQFLLLHYQKVHMNIHDECPKITLPTSKNNKSIQIGNNKFHYHYDTDKNNDPFHYHKDTKKINDQFHYHYFDKKEDIKESKDDDKKVDKKDARDEYKKVDIKDAKDDDNKEDIKNSQENDKGENIKDLFLYYLNRTGRVSLDNFTCCICNKNIKSLDAIKNHCWNDHWEYLAEITLTPLQNDN